MLKAVNYFSKRFNYKCNASQPVGNILWIKKYVYFVSIFKGKHNPDQRRDTKPLSLDTIFVLKVHKTQYIALHLFLIDF